MEITEVRIKLTSGKNEKLRAFCSITIDNDFVIRDLKVIEGAKGAFVAMPSRKLMARCPFCGGKNHYRAPYCNECGGRLSPEKLSLDGRRKLHADVAHPINSGCRESIQQRVLAHYAEEKEKAKDPDYRPADLDDFEDDFFDEDAELVAAGESPRWDDGSRGAADGSGDSGPELDEASRDRAIEESEWEEEPGAREFREERVLDPAALAAEGRFAGAGSMQAGSVDAGPMEAGSLAAGPMEVDERRDRESVGSGARSDDARSSPVASRDRGGRGGGRTRQRSGGRRRRGRDPRREGARPGELSTGRVEGEKSPLAVDFDDLRSGDRRSGRSGAGRPAPAQGGWRETRRRDEATGAPRFRERGRERAADAARRGENRIPEKRLAEEIDTEPEDNFGAGLFS